MKEQKVLNPLPGEETWAPFRVTRRKGVVATRVNKKRNLGPSLRIRCGCCKEAIVIHHEAEPSGNHHQDTLEIEGVYGTVHQWRKVLLPLLGIDPKSLDAPSEEPPEPTV